MQSSMLQRTQLHLALSLKTSTGLSIQVRNHVKMYPWRSTRLGTECYLDPSRTPYTDKFNINEFMAAKRKRKDWQKVVPKNRDNRFSTYALNDSYKSDPVEAKETAQSRLNRLKDSLRDRGAARESEAYDPPEGVQERILGIYRSSALESEASNTNIDDESVLAINLNQNRALKFTLITKCIEEFNHDLPNSYLNDMDRIKDLVEYFSTPVRGINPYTALLRQEQSLPVNLSLISEPIRFDKETDKFFNGQSALPGIVSKVPGLRGSKKYPILNQEEFQWPDI